MYQLSYIHLTSVKKPNVFNTSMPEGRRGLTLPIIIIGRSLGLFFPPKGKEWSFFMCKQIVVVEESSAEKFQESFNSKMSELKSHEPTFEFVQSKPYCAYIIYSDKDEFVGIVEPANRCICDSCVRCTEPPRRNVKWRKCAIYGAITKAEPICDDYIPGGGFNGN